MASLVVSATGGAFYFSNNPPILCLSGQGLSRYIYRMSRKLDIALEAKAVRLVCNQGKIRSEGSATN
jgi:hypothetical protein